MADQDASNKPLSAADKRQLEDRDRRWETRLTRSTTLEGQRSKQAVECVAKTIAAHVS